MTLDECLRLMYEQLERAANSLAYEADKYHEQVPYSVARVMFLVEFMTRNGLLDSKQHQDEMLRTQIRFRDTHTDLYDSILRRTNEKLSN